MGFLKELGTGLLNAVTGGISGAVGSLFGLGSEAASNAMTLADNKELMQYQFNLQQQGIDKQNEYNLPINQMARLEQAGLNPHLVYGNGSVLGNTSSAASASLGKARNTELERYNQLAQDLTLSKANTEVENNKKYGNLIQANIERTNQDTNESKAREANLNAGTQNLQNQDAWFNISLPLKRTLLENQIALVAQNERVAYETANRLTFMTNKQGEYIDAQITQIGESIAQRWRALNLQEKQLGGLLKLWAQTGDAAVRNSKAQFIFALTGQKVANIKSDQWNTLAPLIKEKLQLQNFGQWLKNKWTEVKNQWTMDYQGSQEVVRRQGNTRANDAYYDNDFMDYLRDFLDFGSATMDFLGY